MNRIIINGKEYNVSGNNITVKNNQIFVDGKKISYVDDDSCVIKIFGDVNKIECKGSVECENVNGDIICGGSVNCDDVEGNINCSGSLNCDNITGDVKCKGSISCDLIKGTVLREC